MTIDRSLSRWRKAVSLLVILPVCIFLPHRVWAGEETDVSQTLPQKLTVSVGKSIIKKSPGPLKRISLAAPEIADVLVLSPDEFYLIGKSAGITSLTTWDERDNISAIYDLEVLPDIARLKEKIHELFPQEKDIRVTATHGGITLSGAISSATNISHVLELAKSYAPGAEGKQRVNNFLEVGGVHQVMLEVRVSEMSRNLMREMGVNFNFLSSSGRQFGIHRLDSLSTLTTAADSINILGRFLSGGATWTILIDALKEQGVLKILAEPTIITLSGRTANFLAGGEIPIPVPSGVGGGNQVTIEYKTFGVGLSFTPTVLSNTKISMLVAPEVSELDFKNAITIQGFVIPALTTRRISTVVELDDGQSFAIAGLLKDDYRQIVRKTPLLGEIPVLGALFRSSNFQKNETELVIIVTPHLVKPVDMSKQTLPTDAYIEPNEFEFYLLGYLQGEGKASHSSLNASSSNENKDGGLEGTFGHINP